MAQTENAMSFVDAKVEVSLDNTAWTDISGFTNGVDVDGGDRAVSEFFTLDGDTPILTKGKRSLLNVTISALYTEEDGEPYDIVSGVQESNGDIYVRWSPKGGATGDFRFTTSKGIIISPVFPKGKADSADAIPLDFTVRVGAITRTTIAP